MKLGTLVKMCVKSWQLNVNLIRFLFRMLWTKETLYCFGLCAWLQNGNDWNASFLPLQCGQRCDFRMWKIKQYCMPCITIFILIHRKIFFRNRLYYWQYNVLKNFTSYKSNCRTFWLHCLYVHSVQHKSFGLKVSKAWTGSDTRYSCHHNSSRFTFPIFAHSWRFSVFHSLQSITPHIY